MLLAMMSDDFKRYNAHCIFISYKSFQSLSHTNIILKALIISCLPLFFGVWSFQIKNKYWLAVDQSLYIFLLSNYNFVLKNVEDSQ